MHQQPKFYRTLTPAGVLLAALLAVALLAGTVLISAGPINTAMAQESSDDAPAAYITVDLTAGFPLDPFVVSVNAGGDVEAASLAAGCVGYINSAPTVALNWTGETDFAEVFFHSNHDPVLVVETPSGEFLCNDDANDLLLDPVVTMDDPETGLYRIWAGSILPDQLLPGFLVLTTREEINVGDFSLDGLVTRAGIPEEPVSHDDFQDEARALLEALADMVAGETVLEAGGEPLVTEAVSAGDVPAFELPTDNLHCTGFVDLKPAAIFEWSGQADVLRIFFEGDGDATLIVHTPADGFVCNDDALDLGTLNPLVDILDPAEGRYVVFVGRIDPTETVTGELTVVDSTDMAPAVLQPE